MAPQILLRVRLPSGATIRVPIAAGTSLQSLAASIGEQASLPGPAELFTDPKFTAAFTLQNASHGDIVYVKREVVAATEAGIGPPPSTVAAPTVETNGKPAEETPRRERCECGPRGMCGRCMPSEDETERYEKELAAWDGKGMSVAVMEAREALKPKVKPQESPHAAAAAIDAKAAQQFQAYLGATGFAQQRFGVCYGKTNDALETEVHAIFEPPQNGDADAYAFEITPESSPDRMDTDGDDKADEKPAEKPEDEAKVKADALASLLGLRPVGIVFSARKRRAVLSGRDVVIAARYASTLSAEERKQFVVLKVVVVNDSGETAFEAYQISDLAHMLYKRDMLAPEADQKTNSGKVLCSKEVLVEGKDTKKVHTEFFLNNIPIKTVESWLGSDFPIENRELRPQKGADVSVAIGKTDMPYYRRISDFHLLLYLTRTFGVDTDMPSIVACIKAEADLEEGYKLMIQSIAAS